VNQTRALAVSALFFALPRAARADDCLPACRSGYVCVQATCVSACNPPCADTERCTEAGECVAREQPPPVVTQVVMPPPPVAASPPAPPVALVSATPPVDAAARDPGWARGAGVLGIVSGVAALSLAIGSEVTKDDQIPLLPLGITATTILGVGVPVTAAGAGSARNHPLVTGSPALRIVGWIGYVMTMLDAASLVVVGFTDEPVDGHITSTGVLGLLTSLCFALDAFRSASQAEALAMTVAPPP
jgi:hypothetical protein